MKQVMNKMQELADIIVVDGPPVNLASDATVLATLVDGTVLVIRAGSTRREEASHAAESLRKVNARILGAVLTHVPMASKSYDAYYRYNHAAPLPAARRVLGRPQGRPVERTQESPTPPS
jgi:Mrp family chromosome partitioning ATPase